MAVPMFFRPPPERPPPDQAGVVVIGAEVGGAGMRNLHGNHWYVRRYKLGRNHRSHALVSLVLHHQIYPFADQMLGVAQRLARAVTVVHDNQVHLRSRGSPFQTGSHFAAKYGIGLSGETDSERAV